MRTVGVFAGPSLPLADRLDVPGLTYLPPAARGDVAAAAERLAAILLIDGVFHQAIAPSPKEVLAACRRVPLSVPSVNVPNVARIAARRGLLSAAQADAWVDREALLAIARARGALKRIRFSHRSLS